MWSTLPEFPSFQLRFAVLGRRTLGSGSRWFFLGFFYCAPLLFASTSPNSTPCRYAPMYLPGHRWVRLRVEFFAPVPSTPCGLYRQLSEFDCMQVCSEHYGRFFIYLGLFAVADRVFFLQVPSSICSLEVMVPGCKCKQPIRIGTKMLVLLPVPCNQRMMLRS